MDASQARVIYLSSFEYPSTHGHPLHALSMARAFHTILGDRFLFVIGGGVRDTSLGLVPHASPFGTGFSLLKLFHLRALGYAVWLMFFLMRNRGWKENLIIFTNDLKLAAVSGLIKPFFRFTLIAEVHGKGGIFIDGLVRRTANRMVCVTEGLKKDFAKGDLEYKCSVLGNAVDVDAFDRAAQTRVRQKLNIPASSRIIGYVGRFHPMESDKGVDFLIDSLVLLPQEYCLLLVGGTSEEIALGERRADTLGVRARAFFVPLVPFDERYPYFLAADILAYVPPKEDRFLREETSPMKLYEYMAAQRPVIASDLPTFRRALGDDAFYIPPGSSSSFVEAVARAGQEGNVVAARAYARAKANSWEARARAILQLV